MEALLRAEKATEEYKGKFHIGQSTLNKMQANQLF